MNDAIQLLAALGGSLGFGALFNLHGKKLVWAALGGLVSWAIYLLVEEFTHNAYLCAFVASAALTLYAECMARVHKAPVTIFLVTAAIPLIPGGSLYRTVNHLMQQHPELSAAEGVHTLLFAACMSAGITLTSLMVKILLHGLHSAHKGH